MLEIRPFVGDVRLVAVCSLNGGNVLATAVKQLAGFVAEVAGEGRTTQDMEFRIWEMLRQVDFDPRVRARCVVRLFGERGQEVVEDATQQTMG